ncbi:hypothetical protein A2713_00550 [candidate division WWE3 bacterium RIFCSPHIGHO2_01_FULL_35_17]|uniref:HEPN domain-containing protein n=1 Tax=candidate division WWE3 bacterium RIFCSPHIGHO2_01_FULL_35_17 TaxID=1802614 RepID=A0A1F4USP4_UNCKA|nr:MAG: hypothetical protein A2713_00550 [candidate division WWE3 bacterium RIFCSPHIGHO2_01_FULL_35_17]
MVFKISSQNRKKQFKLLLAKAKERLKSAKVLIDKELYNDAVSRSYYGFFDAANAVLITKGLSAKTHSGVIVLFSKRFIKTQIIPVKYINFFRRAKEAREEADYEIFKKFNKEQALEIYNTAKEFVNYTEKHFFST